MLGVNAIFENEALANALLGVLSERGLTPNRIGVATSDEGEVSIIVETSESEYQEMAQLMREHGASRVDVDMTGRDLDSPGMPTLTDSEPPTPHRAG